MSCVTHGDSLCRNDEMAKLLSDQLSPGCDEVLKSFQIPHCRVRWYHRWYQKFVQVGLVFVLGPNGGWRVALAPSAVLLTAEQHAVGQLVPYRIVVAKRVPSTGLRVLHFHLAERTLRENVIHLCY